jgi:hypothetical protein
MSAAKGLDWFYNWDPEAKAVTDTAGATFVPQLWNYDNNPISEFQQPAYIGDLSAILLMYNEPDTPNPMGSGYCYENGQLSASASQAMATRYCQQIETLQAKGYREFAAPAFSQDPTDENYLNKCVYPFFEAVKSNDKCKSVTKYFTWHMYTPCQEDQVSKFCSDRSSQWKTVMEKVEQDDGFNFTGMYVTEFAGWWQGCQTASDPKGIQGQAMVARVCTKELIKAPRMSAFAWFNDFGGASQPGSSDLWNDDDSLSPIGKAYLEALGHFSSNGSITTASPMTSSDSGFSGSTTESPMTTSDSGFSGSTTESPTTDSGSTTTESPTTHATGYNGNTESESNNGNTESEATTENPVQNTTGAPTVSQGDSVSHNNVEMATGIQCFKDTDCPGRQSCRHMGHAWGVCVVGEQVLIL